MNLLELLEVIDTLPRARVTKRASFATGGAPYQPILMLSIVRLFSQQERTTPTVKYDEVKAEYKGLYEAFYGPQNDASFASRIVQPFWVFGSGRSIKTPIWKLVPYPGNENEEALAKELRKRKDPIKSESQLKKLVKHAEFPPDTFRLLQNSVAQTAITSYTIQRYFRTPAEIVAKPIAFD